MNRVRRTAPWTIVVLAVLFILSPTIRAQQDESSDSSDSASKPNPLVEEIKQLLKKTATIKSSKELQAAVDEIFPLVEKLLESKPSREDETFGIRNKIQLLWFRTTRQVEGAADALQEYCEPLRKDERPDVSHDARAFHIAARIMKLTPKSTDNPTPLQDDITECLSKDALSPVISGASQMLVMHLMGRDATAEAKTANDAFLAVLETRVPDRNVQQLKKLLGVLKEKIDRVGQPFTLAGKTLAGKKFDLKSLKGKVVLVDFWASWCEPCKAEMPKIKAVYDKYRDKGFEIVGVSIDGARQDLVDYLAKEPLPWMTLYDEPDSEVEPGPIAKRLKIETIPAPVLVDREGNIASFSARGDLLEPLVAKALGIELESTPATGEPQAASKEPSVDEPPADAPAGKETDSEPASKE